DRERSATGHGLTLHKPIRSELVSGVFDEGITAWACSGTPADCVKLALEALLETPPDLVLSGINHGANLGSDVLYSGTVSAAMEGLLDGISSLAVSLASFSYHKFDAAAQVACALVAQLAALPPPVLLNVNVPPVEADKIKGLQVARLGQRRYHDLFEKRQDPRGKTYYWLAGEVLEDVDMVDGPNSGAAQMPLDVRAIRDNYVTVTPLHYDLTAYHATAQLSGLQLG
ncbi:MAG: 5'/3'-nucleotidase SurE, partial [Cyanobacteria bacterium J06632_22]